MDEEGIDINHRSIALAVIGSFGQDNLSFNRKFEGNARCAFAAKAQDRASRDFKLSLGRDSWGIRTGGIHTLLIE